MYSLIGYRARFKPWEGFFSRFGGILIWYRANLGHSLRGAPRSNACIMQIASRGMKQGPPRPTLVTYRPLLARGSYYRIVVGRAPDEAGIVWILAFPDASRMTKDPVGLYSFTTLADADRNRSQTNRLVYAVMPIPGRRDGDWMLAPD